MDTAEWWRRSREYLQVRDETKFIGAFRVPTEKRLSRAKDRKVDFVIAGTQKGGTTALDAYLRLHPEICMAHKTKEVRFFDTQELFNLGEPDYRLYHAFFKPKSHHRLLGEASPEYMYFEDVPRRLYTYNPEMKIILSLRNPIERAYSHWNMSSQMGVESLPFGEAIRGEEENLRAARQAGSWISNSYVDKGYYVEQIRRIRRFFPPGQLFIIKQEQLRNDPVATLGAICQFLGVSAFDDVEPVEKLVGDYQEPMTEADRAYLRELYELEVRSLERLLGWDCREWLG